MLQPNRRKTIPELTRIVAKAAFPKGSTYMILRDELGPIFEDQAFTHLYPDTGQPAESPARLALITIMQYVENLTDRQAADAVRARVDWKYALGLELTDPGFHYSVLSEFRSRLITAGDERTLLDTLLERCAEKGLLGGKNNQRTDSTHVLAAIRNLTLIELVGEAMRRTLEAIAGISPDWLAGRLPPEWVKRYGRPFDSYRLPKGKGKRLELAITIGRDGFSLLEAIFAEETPTVISQLDIVEVLRRVWVQRYYRGDGEIYWRTKQKWGQPAAGDLIGSVEDVDARYSMKGTKEWTGYKVHLTETCAASHPRLITQVETTAGTVHDVKVTRRVQDDLTSRGLAPEVHLVDMGYMEADLLLSSQERGIDLVGPMPSSKSWQDRDETAFDHSHFRIDWDKGVAWCPGGKQSRPASDRKTWRGTPNLVFSFRRKDCLGCDLRQHCSRAKGAGRTLTVYPEGPYQALRLARERQRTSAFKELYNARAGIEGTISQAVRTTGLRRSRYIGLDRTHVQHVASAAAINVVRLVNWLNGDRPSQMQVSPLVSLAA